MPTASASHLATDSNQGKPQTLWACWQLSHPAAYHHRAFISELIAIWGSSSLQLVEDPQQACCDSCEKYKKENAALRAELRKFRNIEIAVLALYSSPAESAESRE
jgi:hypothetical protein